MCGGGRIWFFVCQWKWTVDISRDIGILMFFSFCFFFCVFVRNPNVDFINVKGGGGGEREVHE